MNGLVAFLFILLVWLGSIVICKVIDKIIRWKDSLKTSSKKDFKPCNCWEGYKCDYCKKDVEDSRGE